MSNSGASRLLVSIHARAVQIHHSAREIRSKTKRIYDRMLRESRYLDSNNFEIIHTEDLGRLYSLYDSEFFSGMLTSLIRDVHQTELRFRLSHRMTAAAGKTIRTRRIVPGPRGPVARTDYEIAVSTLLLFQTFSDPGQTAIVCGIECRDRLDALLRIFEHEAIHLLEMLLWGDSSCDAPNYQTLASRIFGHQGVRHELITPHARAASEFTLRVGDHVRFEFEGKILRGILNRITRRASVLVPSPKGEVYSNGGCYLKYYVPLEALTREDAGDPAVHSSAD
ncbi:MAG: SprT-like family protein [Isosphaeraceae bacterium]|nr:SprT-like family protein [Isosphaeraceae bacterium]